MSHGIADFAQCMFMTIDFFFFLIRQLGECNQKLFSVLLEAISYCEHINILKCSIQTLLTKHSEMYKARGNVLRLNSKRLLIHTENIGPNKYFLTNNSKNPVSNEITRQCCLGCFLVSCSDRWYENM